MSTLAHTVAREVLLDAAAGDSPPTETAIAAPLAPTVPAAGWSTPLRSLRLAIGRSVPA